MNRKEFLGKLGLGAAFVLTASCLGGCSKSDMGPVDFTINLTDPAYSNLANNGGYIVKDRVVVARDNAGNLVAATQLCSHEDKYQIILKDNEWFCTDHDARFTLEGAGLNEKGSKGISVYQTTLAGDTLRIFS